MHAINGIGLGHVIRTSRVAQAFRRIRPDAEIVFVTNAKYVVRTLAWGTGFFIRGTESILRETALSIIHRRILCARRRSFVV